MYHKIIDKPQKIDSTTITTLPKNYVRRNNNRSTIDPKEREEESTSKEPIENQKTKEGEDLIMRKENNDELPMTSTKNT